MKKIFFNRQSVFFSSIIFIFVLYFATRCMRFELHAFELELFYKIINIFELWCRFDNR